MHDYIVEVDTDVGTTMVDNLVAEVAIIEIITGPQGPQGEQGEQGPQGIPGPQGDSGPENLVVSDTDPGLTEPGLWIQDLGGGDFTFWIEDGT